MGRYVPPEHEGMTSANKLAGKHALGNRGRKAGQGILTIRFEMPFAVWCTSCPKETIIGQGVRFNAEKKKVGNYYSSPIFSFRMKHIPCGGWIEIQTDPKNTAYVVTEGGKKRDTGEDRVLEGDIEIRTEEEKERLRQDAFAALEVTIENRAEAKAQKTEIDQLLEFKDKSWDDTYAANRKLRRAFRAERKVREKAQANTAALQDAMSLGLDILDETEEDRKRAAQIEFGTVEDSDVLRKVTSRSIFGSGQKASTAKPPKKPKMLASEVQADASKEILQKALTQNTRAVVDPFINSKAATTSVTIPGLKRKLGGQSNDTGRDDKVQRVDEQEESREKTGLVNYGSDSD